MGANAKEAQFILVIPFKYIWCYKRQCFTNLLE